MVFVGRLGVWLLRKFLVSILSGRGNWDFAFAHHSDFYRQS